MRESSAAVDMTLPIEYDEAIGDAYEELLAAEATREAEPGGRTPRRARATAPVPVPASGKVGEQEVSRRRGESGAPVVRPSMGRTTSNLVSERHQLPRMARVTLRPSLELSSGGLVERVVISAGHRTPSPFGSRMGDHTVAWQAVVDAVRAVLHGLDLQAAVAALRDRQQKAAAWTTEPRSTGKTRLALLADAPRRRMLLENSAFEVEFHLRAAETALGTKLTAAAVDSLERAVAHHLAFVNYLPFSTVPVPSARGSKGSGEGTYRKILLDVEAPDSGIDRNAEVDDFAADENPDEVLGEDLKTAGNLVEDMGDALDDGEEESIEADSPPPGTGTSPTALRDALWKLFSFEAALRAARTASALQPQTKAQLESKHQRLKALLTEALGQLDLRPQGQPFDGGASHRVEEAKRIYGDAEKLRVEFKEDQEKDSLTLLASKVRDLARLMQDPSEGIPPGEVRKWHEVLGSFRIPAQAAAETIINAATDALPNAAMVLAYLLHDHQLTVATAYPKSVDKAGFLTPVKPAAARAEEPLPAASSAAVERLRVEITARAKQLPAAAKDLDALITATGKAHAALLAVTGMPEFKLAAKGWAADRADEALVVAYNATRTAQDPAIVVNGRAPAPRGVAGMGSHTTAWLVEVAAADAIAAAPGNVVEAFRDAVAADLRSDVMRLDCLLPIDQLRGGQVRLLFDTAVKVLEAGTEKEAAAQYLRFRNVLPYATVDAGDRGGHGESLTAECADLFDVGSLRQAADLYRASLATVAELTAVADDLTTLGRSLASKPAAAWGKHAVVRDAVVACSARLAAQAAVLMEGPPANVVETVLGVRWREHRTTFARATKSRMVVNAKETAPKTRS
ncbi:hypothetical protein [Kitasatospora sp. NPDC094015]|uniref:hypothetical protein n=1 Tax=Kitasatospora sp. NPDC094015 TaxID=3155205 RepID=UPI00332F706B